MIVDATSIIAFIKEMNFTM